MNKLTKFFFVLILSLIAPDAKPQSHKLYVDSYVKASKLLRSNPEIAFIQANVSLKNATKPNQKSACNRLLGLISERLGAYKSSEAYFRRAIGLTKDTTEMITLMGDLVESTRLQGFPDLKLAQKIQRLRESRNDSIGLCWTYNLIASIYKDIGHQDSSIFYYQKAISFRRRLKPEYLNESFYDVSNAFANKDSSRHYLNLILRSNPNSFFKSKALFRLGEIEVDRGNTNLAIQYLKKSLKTHHQDILLKIKTHQHLAEAYMKSNNYINAIKQYMKCDSVASISKSVNLITLSKEMHRIYDDAENLARSLGRVNIAHQFYIHHKELTYGFSLVSERDSLGLASIGFPQNKIKNTEKMQNEDPYIDSLMYVFLFILLIAVVFYQKTRQNDRLVTLDECLSEIVMLSRSTDYHKQDVDFTQILDVLKKSKNKGYLADAKKQLLPGLGFSPREKVVIILQDYSYPDMAKMLGYSNQSSLKSVASSIKEKTDGAWKKNKATRKFDFSAT